MCGGNRSVALPSPSSPCSPGRSQAIVVVTAVRRAAVCWRRTLSLSLSRRLSLSAKKPDRGFWVPHFQCEDSDLSGTNPREEAIWRKLCVKTRVKKEELSLVAAGQPSSSHSLSFLLAALDLFSFSPWIQHSKAGVDFAHTGLVAPRSGTSPITAVRVPGSHRWIYKVFGWIHATAEDLDCFGRRHSRAPNEGFSVRSRWPVQGVNSARCQASLRGRTRREKVGENRPREILRSARWISAALTYTENLKGRVWVRANLLLHTQ